MCCYVLEIFFNSIFFTRSTLNINKYLEEFPGLVHFIYVDRMSHRMIAPGLEFASQETLELTKKKVKRISYFMNYLNRYVYFYLFVQPLKN